MSEKEKDIVSDILGRAERAIRDFVSQPEFKRLLAEIAQTGGGLEQRIADSLAQQIRTEDKPVRLIWGGDKHYVPRRAPELGAAKQRALEEVQRTGRVAEAGSRHGVSRATLYRLLERKK